ncbi:hypothetical protein HZS_7477 [Henneguya salminicola]|nr:hypothetical protein HZS_7477 [Henneguya salminicola]
MGFHHEVIIHVDYFVDPTASEVHTQNSVLQRFLRKHSRRQSPHEFEYVAEFLFRLGREGVYQGLINLIKIKYSFN